jgi:putative oxidoreductase
MMELLMPGRLLRALEPLAPLMIRVPLGVISLAHATQHLFGWWGGHGIVHSIQVSQAYLGIPPAVTILALIMQLVFGALVLIGFQTRLASLGLATVMLVAMIRAHLPNGFFLNWELRPGVGHGIEMNLALLGMCLALVLGGAGRHAIDRQAS